MKKELACLVAALPVAASAFFDGFNGSALGSHWDFHSEGSGWTHTVSGGELRVTALHGPFDFDEVAIVADVEGFTDFVAEMRVMWDAGTHQTVSFGVSNDWPFLFTRIGIMRYSVSPTSSATVSAFLNSGGNGSVPAPPANEWHVFRIARTGSTLQAWVDGNLVGSTSTGVTDLADHVWVHFGGPETEAFGEIRVDYVRVVPEPGTLAAFGAGLGLAALRRRKIRKSLGRR